MKIFYYTYPWFFDVSVSFIRALSRIVDLHVIVEVAPESRKGVLFDLTSIHLEPGIVSASPVLNSILPENVVKYWQDVKSFHLMVHDSAQSSNPKSLLRGRQLALLTEKINPDLLYFDDVSLRLAISSLFLPHIPCAVGVHDPFPHSGENDWRTVVARKLIYKNANHFILHNEFQKKDFIKKFHIPSDTVKTFQLGVYDVYPLFTPTTDKCETAKDNILFFGRISPYKGLEVFLDAARRASEQLEHATFTIVGKPIHGYRFPKLPDLANGCRFEVRLEHVSAADMGAYFRNTACVVCPYLDATQSGVVLTAYAFNKPVIATRTGGLPEYVHQEETGLLVDPNDPIQLSNAMLRIFQDGNLRARLKLGVLDIGNRLLNWDTIASDYNVLFKALAQNRRN